VFEEAGLKLPVALIVEKTSHVLNPSAACKRSRLVRCKVRRSVHLDVLPRWSMPKVFQECPQAM